jgi:hypothetical protein
MASTRWSPLYASIMLRSSACCALVPGNDDGIFIRSVFAIIGGLFVLRFTRHFAAMRSIRMCDQVTRLLPGPPRHEEADVLPIGRSQKCPGDLSDRWRPYRTGCHR